MQIWILPFLCWLWVLSPAFVHGESAPPFTIELAPDSISQGEETELRITLEGKLTREIEIPQLAGLRQAGSSTSSNISIINGSVSRQTTYSYTLELQQVGQAGTLTFPSFTIEIDGKTYKTKPLSLQVNKAANATPSSTGAAPGGANSGTGAEAGSPAIFVRREFSTTQPYEAEPIVTTVKIYHRVDLAKAEVAGEKAPALRVLPLGEDRGQETVNGETYQVIRLREVWIPQKAGALEVPPFRLQAAIVVASKRAPRGIDDFFSGFFNQGRVVNKTVATEATTLTVRPVPKDPRDHFGLVGSFMGSASLSTHQVKVGETTTLTLQIQGKGSLDRLGKVSLPFPSGLRAYEDKPDIKETPSAEKGLMSRATFKFALVANQAGSFSLGIYRLVFFDPASQKFSEIMVPLGTITVEGAPRAPVGNAAPPEHTGPGNHTPSAAASPLPQSADDVVDLYRGVWREPTAPWAKSAACLFLCLSLLLYLGTRLWLFARKRGASQQRRSRSQAWKQLQSALEKTSHMDPVQGVHTLYSEFRHYLGVLADCKGAALTRQELDVLFASHGIPATLCENLQQIAARLEAGAYSTHGLSATEAKGMMTQLMTLAKEVDRKW